MAKKGEVMGRQLRDILVHVHGIGEIDFSSMSPDDLDVVEKTAQRLNIELVPTIFLIREYIPRFTKVLTEYFHERDSRYTSIRGFGVEGPMLGTSGGVPVAGCWSPTALEWRQIASLGQIGLRYMVIGPDACQLDDIVAENLRLRDVIDLFYTNNVKLALGHFQHTHPGLSARRTEEVIEYIQDVYGPSPDIVITDHLFNDMPRAFTHAWRTPEEKVRRANELATFLEHKWTDSSIEQLLGAVPAVLLRAARRGRLTPVLNFDGDHVDLAVCQRVVEYLGSDRMMAITDHTETNIMAGEALVSHCWSTLRYRRDGIVAAGSSPPEVHRRNMASVGLTDEDIDNLMRAVADRVLNSVVSVNADYSCDADSTGHIPVDGNVLMNSINGHLNDVLSALERFPANGAAAIINLVIETVGRGHTMWVAGNGGSATSANHMAHDCAAAARTAFPGPVSIISLVDNIARITALANDIDYQKVFAEQLRTAGRPGDLLLVLSVSGASPNVVCAASTARDLGMRVAALVGKRGALAEYSDAILDLDISNYGVAEDLHLMFNHMLVRVLRGGQIATVPPLESARVSISDAEIH